MHRSRWVRAWVGFAAAILAPDAWAIYPLVVDDASIHMPEEREWVAAADRLRSSPTEMLSGTLSLATGLRPGLEGTMRLGYGWLRAGVPAAPLSRDGILDINLGLKAPVWTSSSVPLRFTVSTTAKLPTATVKSGLGTGFADLAVLAIGTATAEALLLDLNAGYTWTAIEQRARRTGDAWFAGTALRWRILEPLMLFVESYATRPAERAAGSAVTARVGGQFEFRPRVSVSIAVGRGRNQGVTENLGMLGLTIIN